jgi:tRNA G18 (ribose-2'-O)-methylase SpoU
MGPEMPVFRVDDPTDSRIADYATVRDADLLRVRGLFVAEGRLVVKRLLGCSTLRVRSLLLTEAAYTSIASELPAVDNLPIYIGDLTLFRLITGFNIHRGCLALAERPGEIKVADIVASAERLVILEDIADADNVGAVFRNAAAFGADGVLLSPTCCDPLYRKAIRTSVGAALQVKFGRLADWLSELSDLKRAGFQTIALTPSQDAIDLATLDPLQYPRIALIFGNEGSGLQPGTQALADLRATIRMRAHHDSLNVATAAGIAMHRMFARANV